MAFTALPTGPGCSTATAVFDHYGRAACVMVVLVGSAAAGREVHDELERIRRGEKRDEDEVRRQWDEVTAEARSRWDTLRLQVRDRRDTRQRRRRRA